MFEHIVFNKKWVKGLVAFYIVIVFLNMIAGDRWTGDETFLSLIISSIIAFKMVDRQATQKKAEEAKKKKDEEKKEDE